MDATEPEATADRAVGSDEAWAESAAGPCETPEPLLPPAAQVEFEVVVLDGMWFVDDDERGERDWHGNLARFALGCKGT